tara:strand:- start:168 stop:329 length:162 start_codon:yes stop_codon:yes gene_type:complete
MEIFGIIVLLKVPLEFSKPERYLMHFFDERRGKKENTSMISRFFAVPKDVILA